MDSLPPLETVYQAICTLYRNPDTSEKEKASTWLGRLQKSVFAWKIADELLLQQYDVESCYFAAQTMRTKVQLSFHELPLEAHASLRDSLLDHISKTGENTNSVIITQLCLALADLALQMLSWPNPVLDLIARFSSSNPAALLEILTVLPEELYSRALRLGSNRRHEISQNLRSNLPAVSSFLKAVLLSSSDNYMTQIKVFRCFTSWVLAQTISLPQLADNMIVASAFQILSTKQQSGMLHDAAADCVCGLLRCLEDNNNEQALELQLFNSVIALEEGYHVTVASENQEQTINYCRLFTELAEAFLEKIIIHSTPKEPHFAIKIFDLVLTCVGHHDFEVAAITFNLWYRLSEDLYQKNDDDLTNLFKPYIERLIYALCRHCEMEPDHEGLLEEENEFPDFRSKVFDLLKDIVFIVGSSNCFRQMYNHLQANGTTWNSSEASLFIMQAVAKNILPEKNDVVPKVVEAILNLPPSTHVAVRYTSILLLGELCEWIERHPQSLEPVLNFLLYCLQQPQISSVAANSLQSICSACRPHMTAHFNGLLQIVQSLDTFSISNEAAVGLLKGVCYILSQMPHNQIEQAMREMCRCQVEPIYELLVKDDVKIVRGTKNDPVLWIDRLSAIFRYTDPVVHSGGEHPCKNVVTEVWPVLSSLLDKYQLDLRVMERSCRCLKFAVRSISYQGLPILEPLVKQMVILYSAHQHSCFLYLGSVLVSEFANDQACLQGLLEMLQAFLPPTFTILQQNDGLKIHPDTVEDLFRLCSKFVQKAAVLFYSSPAVQSIFNCALLAISLDHKDANSAVMKFFLDFIHSGRTHPTLEDFPLRSGFIREYLSEKGQTLVSNLIHASIFSLQSFMVNEVCDVIVELTLFDKESTSQWLEEALKALPKQGTSGCLAATEEQVKDFYTAIKGNDSTKDVSHNLRVFARLFR